MTNRRDRDAQAFVDQVTYWLTAPYITWPDWEDTYRANDNKWKAQVQRLAHHKEIFATQCCTEFEAMVYISTASLAHPISHDWGQIYMWLFSRWQPELAKEINVLPDRPELNANQQEDLTRLRRWIFKAQMAHLKRKGGDPPAAAPGDDPELRQPNLF